MASDTTTRGGVVQRDPTKPLEADQSLADLLGRLSSDFGELVSTQVALAKVEVMEEVTHAAKGAGMVGGGAVAALLTLVMLSFAAAWGLAEVMAAGLAFLIVGVIWGAIAAALVISGRTQLASTEAAPETRKTIKEDVQWAKQLKS